jgi:hypothetical protein
MCALMRDRGVYVCVCVRACLRVVWCVGAECVRVCARAFVQESSQTYSRLCVYLCVRSMSVCVSLSVRAQGGVTD